MSITFKEVEHIYSESTPFAYHALKGVNLDIKNGSFTAVIGQTGSGKSTLIQHINALLLPSSGNIEIDDYVITPANKPSGLKMLRKKAGLVFQFPEYQLFEETIEKDIMFNEQHFRRGDMTKQAVRSTEVRKKHTQSDIPLHDHMQTFQCGDVVIGNNNFGKYKGELQIILEECYDERKNKVGKVVDEELFLLDFVDAWTKFKLKEK